MPVPPVSTPPEVVDGAVDPGRVVEGAVVEGFVVDEGAVVTVEEFVKISATSNSTTESSGFL